MFRTFAYLKLILSMGGIIFTFWQMSKMFSFEVRGKICKQSNGSLQTTNLIILEWIQMRLSL